MAAGVDPQLNFFAGVASHTSFREMMDALPIAVYATDAQGCLTYFNEAAVRLSGRTPELGSDQWCVTWKLFLAGGTPLPHSECPMALALRGEPFTPGGEYIAERPDGTHLWFSPYPALLRDAAGRVTGGINMLVDVTQRKAALRESEERYRAIVETTPECVKVVAPDGTLLHMNAPGLSMVGAESPESVIGQTIYDLIAPEDRQRFQEFNQRICAGARDSLEFEMVGLHGKRLRMESHAAPLRYSDGNTVHLAITRNVTGRREAERASLLLSAIVDSSDDAIISKDLNGIITSWNKGAERVFGYQAAEVIGQPVTIIIPRDRLEEEPKILDELKHDRRVDHFETLRRHKDGRLINISLTISPVKDGQGRVVGASKIGRDITSSKLAEAALRASETRFRQLADSMPQIVWTARPDGYLDYYNQRWYEFTGFSRETFGDASWEPLLHPDDLPVCKDLWSRSIQSGEPYHIEYRFRDRFENRWRWFMGRALPVRDEQGRIVKWFGTCTDIDAQKRTEEELRRANQDLEQFAFSASHDLQEPLRSVKIYSELLSKRCRDKLDGEALEFLGHLTDGASRMELLVRDLLVYTQVSQSELRMELSDASEALSSTLANLHEASAAVGARITSGPLPEVPIQRSHLQQLFQNLIGNAMKYRSPDRIPLVHVTAQRENEYWEFSVSDNGIGIDPQYKEKIFGLFKRLHTNEEYSGTGIGLAICQRIVDRYRGRIWVESTPGQGSCFRFTLPV